MADLRALQDFAQSHGFGLTAPLRNAQVTVLAENWLPEVFFHEDERFHPISLDEVFSMVVELFATLPAGAQEEWRVSKVVRDPAGPTGVTRAFDPPVVHVPDGLVSVQNAVALASGVLSENRPARDALELPEVDADARVTHGASFVRSAQFFGATQTAGGGAVASTGDPFLPRATREESELAMQVRRSSATIFDVD